MVVQGGVCDLIPCQSADVKCKNVWMTNEQPRISHFIMRLPNTKVEGYKECLVKVPPQLLRIAVSNIVGQLRVDL